VAVTDSDLVGESIDAIDTPALVVDLDLLNANLKKMSDYFADLPCKIRPHFKSHKCVELARRQIAAGNATGITCAKLSEAEHLVAGGVTDVLIANQVVGPRKADRLAAMNAKALVRSAVDSASNIDELGQAAERKNVTIPVLIEVDIGMKRCGVPPGDAVIRLAEHIQKTPGVRFDGLQGYEGHLVSVGDDAERGKRTQEAMAPLVATRRALEEAGIPVDIVSGGSSSTYAMTGRIEGIDEVQCGSYALMDWKYSEFRPNFEVSRWVLATVISAKPGRAVFDVGLKGMGCDFGPPRLHGNDKAVGQYTAEEHTPFDNVDAQVGDRFRLIPSHGCTTNALHRRMWIIQNDRIVDVWAIEGAGCLD